MTAGTANPAPLIAIVGPTGTGKSELALKLAGRWPAEIVNCDSVQMYRGLDIGAAKVPLEQRRGIPHHLLDIADPDEIVTAGDYARLARPLIRRIADSGHLPLVVGGTGFYLRALIDGLFKGPRRDEKLRSRLAERERLRPGSLHRLLSRLDPASSRRIHQRDGNKLIRALEVRLLTGRPLSELHQEGQDRLRGFRVLKLGLDPPRDGLFVRLGERAKRMFAGGLVEEVEQILSKGFPENSKALEALGYRQALMLRRGELTRAEAIALTERDTRRYAKRQWTWFRRDADVVWLKGFGDDPDVEERATEHVERFLNGPTSKSTTSLYREYLEAAKDKQRQEIVREWEVTDVEGTD